MYFKLAATTSSCQESGLDCLKNMAILNEQISGTKIINEIQSSNIRKTEFDTETKELVVEFNNGLRYSYENVPHQVYTQFRMSESQGKFFNTKIAKTYKYKKL
jgi:aspartokinase-like uncharacterized kinase